MKKAIILIMFMFGAMFTIAMRMKESSMSTFSTRTLIL